MKNTPDDHSGLEPLQRDALAWILRLKSGEATVADAEALKRWRAQSPEHEAAFREAVRIWKLSGTAAREVAGAAASLVPAAPRREPVIGRRALLFGSMAASAAAVAVLATRPPLGMWPSLEELAADYRTTKGQRRQVLLADGVTLLLNTQTSVAMRAARQLELVSGEAIVTCQDPGGIEMTVGDGRIRAERADFSARRDGNVTTVVCMGGEITVEQGAQRARLTANSQVTFSEGRLGAVRTADLEAAIGWRTGVLIFKNRPLSEVVEELNRYRSGRIVILRGDLAALLVNATFHLDRLDDVAAQITDAFGVNARTLPGGLVLLG